MRIYVSILCFVLLPFASFSQQKWDLKTCVEYAMLNNINVRQSAVQQELSSLTFKQSKAGIFPNLNLGGNSAFNSGNNQDPTTFTRVTENYLSAGMQLQTSADIFNFFSKRKTIAANQWEFLAAQANVGKIKNDIALSVANTYLQVLLAHEQVNIAAVQIGQTAFQLENTRKMVLAGSMPELNVTQLEAQLASDSGNYIAIRGNYNQALLSLQSLMNLDPGKPFEVEIPTVEEIPVEPLSDLMPEYVYGEALKNQPQQQANAFRLKAAFNNKAAAKAALYPTLSAFGSLGSNYLSFNKRPIYSKTITGYQSTGLVADAGNGILYDVQSPILTNKDIIGYIKPGTFSEQMNDNFRKSLGLSLSVPIFNGTGAKTNFERSKLNIRSIELQQENDNQKLKQDIYSAYNSALVALQKYTAAQKAVDANKQALDFASKRYQIGALSMFELISTQNNLLKAKLDFSINRFDYVFKMKVLEFYKGAGLKL
jgi:outer membrane protein